MPAHFSALTGARAGEALWLDWRDVDLERAHVSFPRTKNGEGRGVPLHPRVVATLKVLPHRQGEVFRRPDGGALRTPSVAWRPLGRDLYQDCIQRCLQAGRNHQLHPALVPPYLGNVALCSKPGPHRPDEAWRMELRAHGPALCPRQVGELAHTIERLPSANEGKMGDDPAPNKKGTHPTRCVSRRGPW